MPMIDKTAEELFQEGCNALLLEVDSSIVTDIRRLGNDMKAEAYHAGRENAKENVRRNLTSFSCWPSQWFSP